MYFENKNSDHFVSPFIDKFYVFIQLVIFYFETFIFKYFINILLIMFNGNKKKINTNTNLFLF